MLRYARPHWFVGLVALTLAMGCSSKYHTNEVPTLVHSGASSRFHGPELPITPGGELELLPEHLPRFDLPTPTSDPDATQEPAISDVQAIYRGLTEIDVQCRAMANSEIGNFLDDVNRDQKPPRERLIHHRKSESDRRRYAFEQEIRHLMALEARNQDAAIALELYFGLAQAEVSRQLLSETRDELGQLRGRVEQIRGSGLELPTGVISEDLLRRAITIEETIVEADLASSVINSRLERRLDVKLSPGERFWPNRTWHVPLDPIDLHAATQFALQHRPELRLLRVLIHELDVETLEVFYDTLGGLGGLLGGSPGFSMVADCIPIVRGHARANREGDVQRRKEQLRSLLASRERAVSQEVRQAVETLTARAKKVALARATVESYVTQNEQLREQVEQGIASSIEQGNLELRLLKAQSDLFQAVTGWENARVQLKLAQGAFVYECK